MTKKLWGKLLSVILTISICASAVFGCLIVANAENDGCYTWSEGTVNEDSTLATVYLAINAVDPIATTGFKAAEFTLDLNEGLALQNIEVVGAVDGFATSSRVDGLAFDVADFGDADQNGKGDVSFDKNLKTVVIDTASVAYSTMVLELTFGFNTNNGIADPSVEYTVGIAADTLQIASNQKTHIHTGDGNVVKFSAGCDHVFDVTGLTAIETNTVDGYYVYKDVPCANGCGTVNEYQLVPATELKNVIYWDGTVSTAEDLTGSGTEADPYIIDSAADLAYVTSSILTAGDYYKVADGIDAIVLQPQAHAEAIMALADYAQTKAYFEKITPTVWENGGTFQGTFDGNGVEIYGMYNKDAYRSGLFGEACETTTIKNVAVKNSYFDATDYAGALVGYVKASDTYVAKINTAKEGLSGSEMGAAIDRASTEYLTFEKCVVTACYVYVDKAHQGGVMLGVGAANINVAVHNCLVYGNQAVSNDCEEGLCGNLSTGHDAQTWVGHNTDFSNSIILDCVPYSSVEKHGQAFKPSGYSNVYTNCITEYLPCGPNGGGNSIDAWYTDGKIILIDKSDVKGAAAQSIVDTLGGDWQVDPLGGYPTFNDDVISVGGTILYGRGEPRDAYMTALVATKAGTAESNPYGMGTEDDPFIIESQHHLRTLVQRFDASLAGSYFKVADGIDAFVLQNKNTVSLETLLATPDSQLTTVLNDQWQSGTDTNNWANAVPFSGHIDFNGITIYGMYNSGGGLIQKAQGDCSFKNLSIKKSHITKNGYVGAIVAQISSIDTTTPGNEGSLTIENCSVEDCYIASTNTGNTGPAIFVGYTEIGYQDVHDFDQDGDTNDYINGAVVIKNCFAKFDSGCYVSGNSVYGGVGLSSGSNNIKVSNCLILGAKPYTNGGDGTGGFQHFINSDNFSNVYTDQSVADGKIGANAQNYSNGKITQISATSVEGAAAKDTLTGFDFDSVWSYDGNGGYPTPVPQDKISTQSQSDLNLLGCNIAYNNDGSFNFNFYYEPTHTSVVPVLYVGRADGDGFTKLTGTALTADDIAANEEFKKAGLEAGTLFYSIKNISAREIGDTLLGTAVAKNGTSTVWGKTEAISVSDYVNEIIKDSSVDAADKQVAAALVYYGTASTVALNTAGGTSVSKTVVSKWHYDNTYTDWYDTDLADNNESGENWDNAIIIDSANEFAWLVATGDGASYSSGKYYKVADNIKAFDMNITTDTDMSGNMTPEEVKAEFDGKYAQKPYWNAIFDDNFDGNGVIIYGLRPNHNSTASNAGGVFGSIAPGSTVKNFTIKNSYFSTTGNAGAVMGNAATIEFASIEGLDSNSYRTVTNNDVTKYYKNGTTTIENVVVTGCYVESKTSNKYRAGVMVGYGATPGYNGVTIKNSLVYKNKAVNNYNNKITELSLIGELHSGFNSTQGADANAYNTLQNSIILDCEPYPIKPDHGQNGLWPTNYTNVYTDDINPLIPSSKETEREGAWYNWNQFDIKEIDANDIFSGAAKEAMPKLAWGTDWMVGYDGEYPMPIQNGSSLSDGKTVYLNGSATAPVSAASGTADNPIIINSAEELAWLVAQSATNTLKKHYKIADGIDNIILQPESIVDANTLMSLTTPESVKSYIESLDSSKVVNWVTKTTGIFNGSFDGNGATIYGLYANQPATTAQNAALFGFVDGGGTDGSNISTSTFVIDNEGNTISNINIKNSCYLSNDRIGGITACAYGGGAGYVYGKITYDTCSIVNCYMQTTNSSGDAAVQKSGVIVGDSGGDLIAINNCLVYGNYAQNTALNVDIPLYGKGPGSRTPEGNGISGATNYLYNTVSNTISIGTTPYNTYASDSRQGVDACYSNVYTDMPTKSVKLYTSYSDYSKATVWWTFNYNNIKPITNLETLKGAAGQTVVDALNNANDDTVWYPGNDYNYPGFKAATTNMPNEFAVAYNNLAFDVYDIYDVNGTSNKQFEVYATSINLKNNPYLGITFAFNGDYKANRDQIEITLTKKQDGTLIKNVPAIPAYNEGEYISDVNGWTNKKNAGKYHLYTLNDIAIYDLCEPIVVTMTYGDTTVESLISISGFANDMQTAYLKSGNVYYANCAEAVKALLFYTQSLKAAYNK